MAYQQEELLRLQKELTKILQVVDGIFKENGIKYCLWGGTAIGAVRDGGFIPWDDDIDIVLLKNEYDRALKVLGEQLPQGLTLQTHDTDKGSPFYFAKVRQDGTLFMERYCQGIDMHHGLFIDIFPLIGVPDDESERRVFMKQYRKCVQLYNAKNLKTSFNPNAKNWKKALRFALHQVLRPVAKDRLYRQLDALSNKYTDTKYVKLGGIDERYIYEREWFIDSTRIPFGDIEAEIAIENDKILRYRYGDYMKRPAEKDRYNHRPMQIRFLEQEEEL